MISEFINIYKKVWNNDWFISFLLYRLNNLLKFIYQSLLLSYDPLILPRTQQPCRCVWAALFLKAWLFFWIESRLFLKRNHNRSVLAIQNWGSRLQSLNSTKWFLIMTLCEFFLQFYFLRRLKGHLLTHLFNRYKLQRNVFGDGRCGMGSFNLLFGKWLNFPFLKGWLQKLCLWIVT